MKLATIQRMARQGDMSLEAPPGFPSEKTFRRFGGKRALMAKIREFCSARGEDDIAALCEPEDYVDAADSPSSAVDAAPSGYVYLVRHGSRKEYKIGRTFNPLRREGELRTELPEQLLAVHQIQTDDPPGVEKYWHTRFAAKRKNGEWFALDAQDIRAFKK